MLPWEGIALANSLGSKCMQFNPFPLDPNHPVEGSEDCLYINVYTPDNMSNSTELLPVLFFIHGIGFNFGDANDYDPKYLMDRNVVLFTFNYRLGALGEFIDVVIIR